MLENLRRQAIITNDPHSVQTLIGRRNPIATETAATGKLRPGKALRDALAQDLDALQKLSVTESTLVSWVDDVVSGGMPEGWRAAGVASAPQQVPAHG